MGTGGEGGGLPSPPAKGRPPPGAEGPKVSTVGGRIEENFLKVGCKMVKFSRLRRAFLPPQYIFRAWGALYCILSACGGLSRLHTTGFDARGALFYIHSSTFLRADGALHSLR